MKKFILFLLCISLIGCDASHNVGLYKDVINQDAILAIFPSKILETALSNCESTLDLYKKDDEEKKFRSPVTDQAPVYYCQEIK